jgi:dihydrofolate reductase
MRTALVAAVAANGIIGADGRMPWHYPEDLAHFERTTTGNPVIVGRRTFETIHQQLGTPLPERRNIVLTHRPESLPEEVVGVSSPAAAVREASATDSDTAYVAGGASVYEQFLPGADELVLTELEKAFEGDTSFPTVDWEHWRETNRDGYDEFDIVTYVRAREEEYTGRRSRR